MKALDTAKIKATHQAVIEQGEPQPVTTFEDRIGNLRGLLSYLSNSVDTLTQREADEYGAIDAGADRWLALFAKELAAAQAAVLEINQ